MVKLLIIADDFTGGLDTGVQFAAKGISTRVVTDPKMDYQQAARECEVLVAVVETRHLPADQAYEKVRQIVKKSIEWGIPHLYKKTDSALRGNIGAELTATLDASGEEMLAFLPALPGIRRTTQHGIHYIDGVPVAESVFGQDPFEPVRESDVAKLIAVQSDVSTCNATPASVPNRKGIVIIDAQSDEDLRIAGQKLAAQNKLHLMAGCAGFAAMLPELLELTVGPTPQIPKLDPGLFLVCGSVNPITKRQLAMGEKGGFKRLRMRPEQKLNPRHFESSKGQDELESLCRAGADAKWLILDTNDVDDSNAETTAYAAAHGMTTEDIRVCISDTLGRILPKMLSHFSPRTLLITGGDTLLQCMNHMNVFMMRPLVEMYPGVVLSQFDVDGQSRFVISKSGGFGKETLLCDLKTLIETQHSMN